MARQTIKAVSIGSHERSKLNANFTELYAADVAMSQSMSPGSGFTGTGTIYKAAVSKVGSIYVTQILLDLTGTASVATDLDIIGTHATNPAHIGQLTAAINGSTILAGSMKCLEVPVGGAVDIDLYSATEGTGAKDGLVTDLAETALITSGGNWTLALEKALGAVPTAGQYLYLTSGAATAGTYSAGKFLISLYGYDA